MNIYAQTLTMTAALLIFSLGVCAQTIPPNEQINVLHAAADLIESRYVDAQKARQIAKLLRESDERWQTPLQCESFAEAATTFFRAISNDGHLGLSYSAEEIPVGNGEEVFSAAMNVVAQADALIIDLRRNGGGMETANLLTGYLLEPGSPLSGVYDRPTETRTYSSSPAWVPGRRFGSTKPLFILTSGKTFSAAEAVAYDLQVLKRAMIIGEVTGGGAHPFEYRRVHPHFAVDLPEGKSINPVTGSNWQDIGVKPDVLVSAEQALDRALQLAREALFTKNSEKSGQ